MNNPRPSKKLNSKLTELATSSQSVEKLAREVKKKQARLLTLSSSIMSYITQLKSEFKGKTLSSIDLADKLMDTMKNIQETLKTKPVKADIDHTLEQLEQVLQGETVIDRDAKPEEESEVVSPKIVKPGAVKPGAVKPGAVKPGAVKPGAVKPGAVKPGDVKPGAVKPGDDSGDVKPGDDSDADAPAINNSVIKPNEDDGNKLSSDQEIDEEKGKGLINRAFNAVNEKIDSLLKQKGGFRYSSGYNNIPTKNAKTRKSAVTGKSKRISKISEKPRRSRNTVKKSSYLNKNTTRKNHRGKNHRGKNHLGKNHLGKNRRHTSSKSKI